MSATYELIKAVAYELKPFSLPTKEGLISTAESCRKNAEIIWCEAKKLAPIIWRVIASFTLSGVLKVSVWLAAWAGATYIEFGAVFIILSSITFMFMNLGTRAEGEEFSAYSVFNAGCRAILGALDAKQFERELMHQVGGVNVDSEDEEDNDFVMVDHPGGNRGAQQGGGRRKVRGKKARRDYEQRRERQAQEAAARQEALIGGMLADD